MQIKDSQRLSFALMTADDADLMYELDNDPQVMKYITNGQVPTKADITNIWLPRLEKYTDPALGWGLWKVMISETETFIGWVLVRPMAFFSDTPLWHDIELGWRFKQQAWGKGYATEATEQIMAAIGKQNKDITHFSAMAVEGNAGSINIMKKIGMSYVKTDVYEDAQLGDLDVVYYTMKVPPCT